MNNINKNTVDLLAFILNNRVAGIELRTSRAGHVRVYWKGLKTSFVALGGGYDKTSAALALLINKAVGARSYSCYTGGGDMISYGIGLHAVESCFKNIGGIIEVEHEKDVIKIFLDFSSIVEEVK